MEEIRWLNVSISNSPTKIIKLIHKLIFNEIGDRGNRGRLRVFKGLEFEIGSKEYEEKVKTVLKEFTDADLISICQFFRLEHDGDLEERARRICTQLVRIDALKDRDVDSDSEADEEQEPRETTVLIEHAREPEGGVERESTTSRDSDLIMRLLEQNEILIRNLSQQKTNEFNIVPDFKANIDKFQGKEKRHDAQAWINSLNGIAKLHGWPDEFKLEAARASMIGPARHWFLSKSISSWEQFEQNFRRTYIGKMDSGSQWKEMLRRTQGKMEDVEDYFQEKIRMGKSLGLTFSELKLQVIEGLWSKELSDHLMGITHNDEDELRDSIEMFERVNKARVQRIKNQLRTQDIRTYGQSAVRNNRTRNEDSSYKVNQRSEGALNVRRSDGVKNSGDDKPPVNVARTQRGNTILKCYSCGKSGHFANECTGSIESRICRACGEKGHIAKDCRKTSPVNIMNQTTQASQEKYIKQVRINDMYTTHGLIDSGACDCTIRESVVERLGLRRAPLEKTLMGFGSMNQLTPIKEAIDAVLDIDGVLGTEIKLLIVPDVAQIYEMIIGRSFLDQPHIAFCSLDGILKIGYREEDPFKDLKIEKSVIPVGLQAGRNVDIPPSSMHLIDVVAGEKTFSAWVTNESSETVEIREGEKIDKVYMLDSSKYDGEIGMNRKIQESEINVGETVTDGQKNELLDLLNEFPMCFATTTAEIGLTNVTEMEIVEEPSSRPVQLKPYRASRQERQEIADIVDEWKAAGIVSESRSPYASPVLLVKKKNGENRLVVDYRRLNNQTVTQTYPIPNIDDQLEALAGAEYFVVLDLAHGYLQVPLSEDAKQKTAFVTPDDHAQFERMVFGLKNAPYEFSRLMNRVLGHLRNNIVLCYLDDLLIPARSWVEMLVRTRCVLEALREARLTLRLQKCHFASKRIEYLGFEVTTEGIKPGTKKTEVISLYPTPKNVHDVRRFLGLASFFRRFVKKFAQRAQPLTSLTRKATEFYWGEDQERAFTDLKTSLTTSPVLKLYDPKAYTELHTDASSMGLAGILLQKGNDGAMHLVYCISKRTSEAEKNYHSSKLELLAAVWCVERLRQFLINIPFTLVTDCQALVYLNSQKTRNPQVCRWQAQLQEYNFQVKHRPGNKMEHVDALSRSTRLDQECNDVEPREMFTLVSKEDEVYLWQIGDEKLKRIAEILEKSSSDRSAEEAKVIDGVKWENGLLYKEIDGRKLLMIPVSYRKLLAVRCHDMMGHFAIDRTLTNIKRYYWFPGMRRYVRRHIDACIQCKLNKNPSGRKQGQLHPIPVGKRPFAIVHLDHLGPFPKSKKNNSYLLLIVDNLTKFTKLHPVKNTQATSMKHLKNMILERGIPEMVITDRGTAFTAKAFEDFCKENSMKHNLISVRHPRANGLVERVNRTVLPVIRSIIESDDGSDWDKKIQLCEQALNLSVNQTTGKSPLEMLYGYQPRFDNLDGELQQFLEHDYKNPEQLQEDVRKGVEKSQKLMKLRFDAKIFKGTKYSVGDVVFIRQAREHTGQPTKTQPRYRGPFAITAVRGGDSYSVMDLRVKKGRIVSTAVHVSDIKPWRPESNEAIDDSSSKEEEESDEQETEHYQSTTPRQKRTRVTPRYLGDYQTN